MSHVYFTDRDLGKSFPRVLRAAGLRVERHLDHFEHNTPDDVWLAQVSARGWIAVTHNLRIRYTPNELEAVVQHRASLLVVIGAAKHVELAEAFVTTLSRIEKFVAAQGPPFIAKVYRPTPAELARSPNAQGRITLWYP